MLMYGPHIGDPPQEDARRFSELSKTGAHEPIVEALRREFPFVKALGIEFSVNVPMIFASVGGGSQKIPVGLISDGIWRLTSMLIGMATFQNGAVLIDQIEDGFYFNKLPSIWKILYEFAVRLNVQIMATTHSQECLRALLPTIKENEDDFALLRAEKKNGDSAVTVTKGKFFESALKNQFDVR